MLNASGAFDFEAVLQPVAGHERHALLVDLVRRQRMRVDSSGGPGSILGGAAQPADESDSPVATTMAARRLTRVPSARRAQSFVIILDASASMEEKYTGTVNKGHLKFTVAKDIVMRINNTLPEIDIKSALVTFGHGFFTPLDKSSIVCDLTQHLRDHFADALNRTTPPQGSSPAGDGIEDAWNLLLTSGGQNAVILVSDGKELIGSPMEKIKDLKDTYGDRVCLYTIFVGNTPEDEKALRELVRLAKCGFSVTADEIASSDNMADFVKKVFLNVPLASHSCPQDRRDKEDHNQRFGLPEAVDAASACLKLLATSAITSVRLDEATGDLDLAFGGELRLEIIATSTGYQNWQIHDPKGVNYLAGGHGRISAWKS